MKTENKARPILRWPGGKRRLLKKLLPLITPHTCYCEAFAGGLAVLFAKERSAVEVVNDTNGDLVALYLNAQRHLPELLRQVEEFTSGRRMFQLLKTNPGVTELERAARFLFRNRTSFGGGGTSVGICKTAGGGAALSRAKVSELLQRAHERLDNVFIESVPYERCLETYDGPETFFFMDPPYVDAPTGNYEGWKPTDAVEFSKRVKRLKGQWVVTINDSPLTRDLFAGYPMEAVQTQSGITNRGKTDKHFGELIIQKEKA